MVMMTTVEQGDPGHVTWLVPVRVDLDGTWLVPCPYLDGAELEFHFWALWCADCGGVVGEPVVRSAGVQQAADLPYPEDDLETLYSRMHAHAVAAGILPYRPGPRPGFDRDTYLSRI